MFDLGTPSQTLADALYERDRREGDFSRNLAESLAAGAIAETRPFRANPIQLRLFGDLPNVVRPEKRPWPKTIAPAEAPRKKRKYYGRKVTENKKPTEHEMSYVEIGKVLDLSYERVRQIEKEALRKLRIECERVGLTPDVFLRTWRGCR